MPLHSIDLPPFESSLKGECGRDWSSLSSRAAHFLTISFYSLGRPWPASMRHGLGKVEAAHLGNNGALGL